MRTVADPDRGGNICSPSAAARRITAAAKDPYCAFWGGQFTVDIITPKEYKEGITAR